MNFLPYGGGSGTGWVAAFGGSALAHVAMAAGLVAALQAERPSRDDVQLAGLPPVSIDDDLRFDADALVEPPEPEAPEAPAEEFERPEISEMPVVDEPEPAPEAVPPAPDDLDDPPPTTPPPVSYQEPIPDTEIAEAAEPEPEPLPAAEVPELPGDDVQTLPALGPDALDTVRPVPLAAVGGGALADDAPEAEANAVAIAQAGPDALAATEADAPAPEPAGAEALPAVGADTLAAAGMPTELATPVLPPAGSAASPPELTLSSDEAGGSALPATPAEADRLDLLSRTLAGAPPATTSPGTGTAQLAAVAPPDAGGAGAPGTGQGDTVLAALPDKVASEAPAPPGNEDGAGAGPPLSPQDRALLDLIVAVGEVQRDRRCVLALPRRIAGEQVGLLMAAARENSMSEFLDDLGRLFPDFVPPQIERVLVDARQCAALDFIAGNRDYPGARLGLQVKDRVLNSGEVLRGFVVGDAALDRTVLIVDDNGVVHDLSRFLQEVPGVDGALRFDAPLTRRTGTRETRLLLIVLATPASLDPLRTGDGLAAKEVFTQLPRTLLRDAQLATTLIELR